MTLGNGVIQTDGYNNRLQIGSITAKKGTSTLLGLGYMYPAANNGSLYSQEIKHDAIGSETTMDVTQTYSSYDAMNRLTGFLEGSINQSYDHDRYGNHWVSSNSGYGLNSLTPTGATAYNTTNNRLATTAEATRRPTRPTRWPMMETTSRSRRTARRMARRATNTTRMGTGW